MLHVNKKSFVSLQPKAIANNTSPTTAVIDTQGFRYLEVFVILGATDIALTALKLQEADAASDANTLTSGADITETVFGTANNDTGSASTLPSATDDNSIFKFEIDLHARKRYVKPVVTIGNGSTGAFVAIFAQLSRGEQVPTTASQKGVAQLMRSPSL